MSLAATIKATRPTAPFASQHPADHNVFLALLVLTWTGIISGFGLDVINHTLLGLT